MTILSSDIVGYRRIMVESSFYWRKHFRDFPRKSWPSRFRGRRSIWWGWRVTWLAPRIGNDVSYVTQTTDDIDFVWQVQYLVRLEGHFVWQAQYLVRLAGDFSWRAQHFVTFWEIAGCEMLYFTIQNRLQAGTSKVSEAAGARWRFYRRISSDIVGLWSNRLSFGGSTSGIFRANLDLQDFVAGAVVGEVGGWLYLLHALEMTFHMWRRSVMTLILRGRPTIWWSCRVPLLPPRIGNDLSYVTQITDDIDFAWQAQYLVKLDADSCCAAHCKWRFKVVPE